jgi:hypothetical protein
MLSLLEIWSCDAIFARHNQDFLTQATCGFHLSLQLNHCLSMVVGYTKDLAKDTERMTAH